MHFSLVLLLGPTKNPDITCTTSKSLKGGEKGQPGTDLQTQSDPEVSSQVFFLPYVSWARCWRGQHHRHASESDIAIPDRSPLSPARAPGKEQTHKIKSFQAKILLLQSNSSTGQDGVVSPTRLSRGAPPYPTCCPGGTRGDFHPHWSHCERGINRR